MKARVTIMLKDGVLDPQGEAIKQALTSLEYNNVNSVRQGKVIDLELNESSEEAAIDNIQEMCEKLLANTCLLYTSPSPRDKRQSRMPSSA